MYRALSVLLVSQRCQGKASDLQHSTYCAEVSIPIVFATSAQANIYEATVSRSHQSIFIYVLQSILNVGINSPFLLLSFD